MTDLWGLGRSEEQMAWRLAWRQNNAQGSMRSMTSTVSSMPSIDEDNEARAAFLLEQDSGEGSGTDSDDDSGMLAGSPVRSQPSSPVRSQPGSPVRSQPGSPVRSPRSMGGRLAPCDQALEGASSCATVLSLQAIVQSDADRGDEAACDVTKKALLSQLEGPDSLSVFLALMQPFVDDSLHHEPLPSIEVMKESPTSSPAPRMLQRHEVRSDRAKISSHWLADQVQEQVPRAAPCAALDGECAASLSDSQISGNLDSVAQLLSSVAQ